MLKKFWSGCLIVILALGGCKEAERTVLTSGEKKLVDSLYSQSVTIVRKEADSLCKVQYQLIYDRAVDSLKMHYISEINKIIEGDAE